MLNPQPSSKFRKPSAKFGWYRLAARPSPAHTPCQRLSSAAACALGLTPVLLLLFGQAADPRLPPHRMQPRVFLIGLALLLPPSECTDNTAELAAVPLSNPSFESSSGWSSLNRGSSELWAPVEGSRYARKGGGDSPSHQTTSALCEAGKTCAPPPPPTTVCM